MNITTRITRKALMLGLFGALLAPACATTPKGPPTPVELDGTKWKLVMIGGQLDGRVIQFKKRGKDSYQGTLIEAGRVLQNVVGLQMGTEIFNVQQKGVNQYQGMYKAISGSGAIVERELDLFVDGNALTWNQENAV